MFGHTSVETSIGDWILTFLTLLDLERVGEDPAKPGFENPVSEPPLLLEVFFKLDLSGPALLNPVPDTRVDTVETDE